jgi:tetratricopeptide (TPR) repeat protein
MPAVLAIVTIGVFANGFRGAFLFDDRYNIHDNPRVHALWPPDWLEGQRPVTDLTFAVNWAAGGDDAWGFHLVNLAIHVAGGLLLFGIVRRSAMRLTPPREAAWFAFSAALLWLVHPLQTQSVTYIVQRSESLMGMLYLLTLYTAIRAHAVSWRIPRAAWTIAAVAACALAQGAKPVAVTAPIIIMIYDRALLFDTLRAAWRMRWGLYVGLAATWLVTVALGVPHGLLETTPDADAVIGLGVAGLSPWTYLCTQASVILHYLKLTIWPQTLVLDYLWPISAGLGDAVAPGLLMVALLVVAALAFRYRPWLGFAALWFFIVLAPTSSVVPIADPAFEHRMYLPLAGVVIVALAGLWGVVNRLTARQPRAHPVRVMSIGTFVGIAAIASAARTVERNRDYHSAVDLWQRNADDRPHNPRAYNNLCQALNDARRNTEALAACDRALQLKPDYADALNNLGNVLLALGRTEEAAEACRQALKSKPDFADAHVTLGYALTLLGDLEGAIEHESAALALQPDNVRALNNLGNALARRGNRNEARRVFEQALALAPHNAETHNNLAWLCARSGDYPAAAVYLERAVELAPALVTTRFNLGEAYRKMGRHADARREFLHALRLAEAQRAVREIELIRQKLAEIK